jgi:hypothetical protein
MIVDDDIIYSCGYVYVLYPYVHDMVPSSLSVDARIGICHCNTPTINLKDFDVSYAFPAMIEDKTHTFFLALYLHEPTFQHPTSEPFHMPSHYHLFMISIVTHRSLAAH